MDEKKQSCMDFIRKYLGSNLDALLWTVAYITYVHAIDDIIDGDIPKEKEEKEFLLKTFEFAAIIYSHKFYLENLSALYPLVKMASNTYMDSVKFEGEKEAWKNKASDHLRNCGNELVLAVIEIVGGYDIRRQASLELRELSYWTHHLEDGTPV